MAKTITLNAETRTVSGSTAVRRLRRTGSIPAILYNDKRETALLQLNEHAFSQMLKHHASQSLVIDLAVDGGAPKKVLLKEVQHDGLTDGIIHADFVEISMTKKMRVPVTVRLKGEPVGVSQGGGVLDHLLREVEVECLPGDLVESLEADVTHLEIGHSILVRDLVAPAGLVIVTDGQLAVAGVLAPHAEEEKTAEEVAAEAAAAAEPEVIKAKGKEEAEAGEEAPKEKAAKEKEPKEKEKKEKAK
jgi:large subunit ribosomal protein L25